MKKIQFYIFYCIFLIFYALLKFLKLLKNKFIFSKSFYIINECLTKTPEHIGIAIEQDRIESINLCKLLIYCKEFGIKYISIFSYHGVDETKLKTDLVDTNLHLHKNKTYRVIMKKNLNFYINSKLPRILCQTYEVSQQSIVKVAKHLCAQNGPIDEKGVNECLINTTNGLTDPDLLIVFGNSTTPYGYPLWQIRLTEIYFYENILNFEFNDFYDLMIKYAKCEQRFGK